MPARDAPPLSETPHADEVELLARLRAGDAGAYEEVVRAHTGRMMAVAGRILDNEADAADAVQEGFLALFKSLGGFREQSRISTWLHRVVSNAALMRLRSKTRKPEVSVEGLLPEYYEDGHRVEPGRPWRERPDQILGREESRAAIHEKISRLPEDYRDVLLLRDIQQVSTAEAALELGVSAGVVKTRLHRARQALASMLETEFRHA